jgi:hypothetical protein
MNIDTNINTHQHSRYILESKELLYSFDSQISGNTIIASLAKEGNLVTTHCYLTKNKISDQALSIAEHLYSQEIKESVKKCGSSHIYSEDLISANLKTRWIG